MKKILYLTDLYYPAKGRNYYEENLFLSGILKDHFDIVLCSPKNSSSFENDVDLIIFRNTGSVLNFKEVYDSFRERVKTNDLRTFNDFTGKADMYGKQYLVDLNLDDYPVIPTIDDIKNIDLLPKAETYAIKPKDGADSIGLEFLTKEKLFKKDLNNDILIQPAIDFEYEVSFYFINDKFEYALYAPNKKERWKLERYVPSAEEIEFAKRFIGWNTIEKGIQRVDACKTKDGQLLLVELEDLNPYLSLLELNKETVEIFINDLVDAINNL